jgi:hypothetical protein
MNLRNVTLELSSKPFRDNTEATMRSVCRKMFTQWMPLTQYADGISILLWISDGSEILEYKGNLDDQFEWAYWFGVASPVYEKTQSPRPSIHHKAVKYMDNPPTRTYRWLKRLIEVVRATGSEITGKPVRVGATFDPGPEFAISKFKYVLHREICCGGSIGRDTFVTCNTFLKQDSAKYVGFPEGIPDHTPFGVFLGRQSKYFMKDMGYDYIWFSNGFGFGLETWGITGSLFDGKSFFPEKAGEISKEILKFWEDFSRECPGAPIETRGSNLTAGIEIATDAAPLNEIYNTFKASPPVNSPWAAIDKDIGLELSGWLSHISELTDGNYPFRFYIHDPWFINSPWLDRYEREPYDIYLPLAVSMIDRHGDIRTPSSVNLLTVDDSYGQMPDQVPMEIIPYIADGLRRKPDQAGPFVWVYPFNEYQEMALKHGRCLDEIFADDWFIRGAINNGLPLNTVTSMTSLAALLDSKSDIFTGTVLVIPVNACSGDCVKKLEQLVKSGGNILFYGPAQNAVPEMLRLLNLKIVDGVSGEMSLTLDLESDQLSEQAYPRNIFHHDLFSGGPLREVIADRNDITTAVKAVAVKDALTSRITALARKPFSADAGKVCWVRTINPAQKSDWLRAISQPDPNKIFHFDNVMRLMIQEFGFKVIYRKDAPGKSNPKLTVSRNRNAFYLSVFCPDTMVEEHVRFPFGAPIMSGTETELKNGAAVYRLPHSTSRECRIFVEQTHSGAITCHEVCSVYTGISRRLLVTGLKAADITFFPETGSEKRLEILQDPRDPFLEGNFITQELIKTDFGASIKIKNISGNIMFSW